MTGPGHALTPEGMTGNCPDKEKTMKTIEELEAELKEAEAEYRAAQYRLDEGDGSFSRMLEARERLYTALLEAKAKEPNK